MSQTQTRWFPVRVTQHESRRATLRGSTHEGRKKMGSATTVEVKCGSATEVIPSHGGYIVQARVGGAVFDIGIKFLYDLTPWQERALGIRAGEAHRHQRLFVSTGSSISLRAVTDDMAPT